MVDIIKLDQEVASDQAEVETFVKKIRPSWESDDFTVQPLEGGLINRLWKATHSNDEDAIFVKIQGKGQAIFERPKELRLIEILHKHAIIPPVYAIFSNGYAYKFAEGGTLTPQQLFDLKVSRLVIEKMHQIQALDVPDYTHEQQVQQVDLLINGWGSMKEIFQAEQSYKEFFDHDEFCKALDAMKENYTWLCNEFPLRFCHVDMHSLNLIYNETKGELAVLDWELAGITPVVLDIARHFCMDVGSQVINAGIVIPEQKDFIEQFVRLYLETRPGHKKEEVMQEMVDKWMHGVYLAMENTLLVTTVWGLFQCQTRKDDDRGFFDFVKMCEQMRRVTTRMLKEGLK